jgi:hypothetical protein
MLQRQPTLAEYTQAMTELAAANAERWLNRLLAAAAFDNYVLVKEGK